MRTLLRLGKILWLTAAVIVLQISCAKEELETVQLQEIEIGPEAENGDTADLNSLEVRSGFDFTTDQTVEIEIKDNLPSVRYTVFINDHLVRRGFVVNGALKFKVKLAATVKELVLSRSSPLGEEEYEIPVTTTAIVFDYAEYE